MERKRKGRPYRFTPEEFEKAWRDYFAWCDETPWCDKEAIKTGNKAGQLISIPTQRPYTEVGFCGFHGLGEKYLSQLAGALESKTDSESLKLSDVLSRARAKCYAQKFEGAAVGVFNANIVGRFLGLASTSERWRHP